MTFFIILFICMIFNLNASGQNCMEFDRYVSGEYYDTYVICSDDIYIDLQDFTTQCDLFHIEPPEDVYTGVGMQNIGNNQWKRFFREVTVVPTQDITVDTFYFNTHDNYQSFNFTFSLEGTSIYCDKFILNNHNYRNYFNMDCQSVLSATTSVDFVYDGETAPITGVINTPHMYVRNGNNTSVQFTECSLVKTDTLVLDQSAQNNVKIDGHIIVDHLETGANLSLQYSDATVTIGDVPNGVKIFGDENTTLNLCRNKTSGADNIGYFEGSVMYNTGDGGWITTTPSTEGDINYNDNSSFYWQWIHNGGKKPTELGAYRSYDECIDEYVFVELYMRDDRIIEDPPNRKPTTTPQFYSILGQKLNSGNPSRVVLKLKL